MAILSCLPDMPIESPYDAIQTAFRNRADLKLADLNIAPIEVPEPDMRAWRWQLTQNAPAIEDADVTSLPFNKVGDGWVALGKEGHPLLRHGVVIEDEPGWVVAVATDDEEDDKELIEQALTVRQF